MVSGLNGLLQKVHHWQSAFEGNVLSWETSSASLLLLEVSSSPPPHVPCHELLPFHIETVEHSWPWPKTSGTMRQNKSFFPFRLFISDIWHSDQNIKQGRNYL